MENKEIIIIAAIVVLIAIGGVYLYSTNTGQNNTMTQNTSQNTTVNETHMKKHTESTETHKKTNETIKTNITAAQAKEIAKKYIGEPGAYPGTPTLFYQKASGSFKGGYIWEVPIMYKGKWVDGIQIDAQTGENLGEG